MHNIEVNVIEIGFQGVDWIQPAQNWVQWRSLLNMAV